MSVTLLDTWSQLVKAAPARRCLIEAAQAREFTRVEVDDQANAWLERFGAGQTLVGRRVAFSQSNGLTWFALFLGLLKARAIPVPLDGTEPLATQRQIASSIGAAYLWNGEALEPLATAKRISSQPDLCLVKLTSGSTGTPRALTFTHGQMIADGRQICSSMAITPDDLKLTVIPLGHSYGLGNLVVPLLVQGTAVLCVSAPLPQAIANDAARWQPTIFPAVPALLRVLIASDVGHESLQSLRTVISAGAALSAEIARGFSEKFGRRVHGFYGSSETGGITYDREGTATLEGRSVGQPMDGVTLRFVRQQRFWVESAAVYTRGNRRRATTLAAGAFRPADRALLNAEGELQLLGRTGRMMKIAGRRLDLSELEQTLKRLPGIRDAYVIPHPQVPEAVATALATTLSPEEARALLRKELAPWKIPRRLLVLPEFPLTARGKTHTAQLREKLERTS